MPAPIWKEIYHGAYKINKSGTIVRVLPAMGATVGKPLTPYKPVGGAYYVHLSFEGIAQQFKVSELLEEAFH